MKHLCAGLAGVALATGLGFSASVNTQGILDSPTIRLEISGECGKNRLVSVEAALRGGLPKASDRAPLGIKVEVTFVQQGIEVARVENWMGVSNPLTTAVPVPSGLFGDTDVTASVMLYSVDRRGEAHSVATAVSTARGLDVPEDPYRLIYRSLSLEDLETANGQVDYDQGEPIYGTFKLVNRSEQDLCIPANVYFPEYHTVGVQQHWILRLGSDSDIPTVPPQSARDEAGRYAAGGEILVTDFSDNSWPSGASVTRAWSLFLDTSGFPSGQYRYFAEYKSESFEVLQTASVDINIGTTPKS